MFLDLEFYMALQSTSSGGSKGGGGGATYGPNFSQFHAVFFLENLAKSYFDIPGGLALSVMENPGSAAVEESLTSVKPSFLIAVKI